MKIRIELDEVICSGEVTVAAVVKRWVHYSGGRHALSIHGAKRPVAVLIRRRDVTTAFEVDGGRIAWDDFDQRFPGQRAAFERIAAAYDPASEDDQPQVPQNVWRTIWSGRGGSA